MAKDKVQVDVLTNTKNSVKSLAKYTLAIGAATLAVRKAIRVAGDLQRAYFEQERAEIKLVSALLATKNAVGITANEMKAYAEELSTLTGLSDEALLSAEGLLVTFTKIGKEVFPDALKAAAEMSVMFGQDLQQSVIQLGTALNDPIQGVGRLRRIGISFSETQREQIQQFMELNDVASAQAVILDELQAEFGGLSEVMAGAAFVASENLKNSWKDLKQAAGGFLSTKLKPFIENLTISFKELAGHIRRAANLPDPFAAMAPGIDEATEKLSVYEREVKIVNDYIDTELQPVMNRQLRLYYAMAEASDIMAATQGTVRNAIEDLVDLGIRPGSLAMNAFLETYGKYVNIVEETRLAEAAEAEAKRIKEAYEQAAASLVSNFGAAFGAVAKMAGANERELFFINKAFALANIAINTALAASKAMTIDPTGILAGLTIAAGVAQGIAVAAQKPPALAEGGIVTKPTMALIGEAGPEAVVPLGKMGGGKTVVINFNGGLVHERQIFEMVRSMAARV